MSNLLLMNKKTYKKPKESSWFRFVWEKEQFNYLMYGGVICHALFLCYGERIEFYERFRI